MRISDWSSDVGSSDLTGPMRRHETLSDRTESKMAAPPAPGGTPITDRRQLVEWFEQGNKPESAWRIGTEHEKFAFRHSDLRRLPYEGPDGIGAVLRGLEIGRAHV